MIVPALIVVLILLLIGALPVWPYSRDWGYYSTGGITVVLGLVILAFLLSRL